MLDPQSIPHDDDERQRKCWASGLTIPACKAAVCDCFDYLDVQPDEAAADAELMVRALARFAGENECADGAA